MSEHQHSWVNTPSGVTCTGCPERIDAPECPHELRFDRVDDNGGQSVRKVVMVCTLCDHEQAVLSTKSDAEIAAEIRAAGGDVPAGFGDA